MEIKFPTIEETEANLVPCEHGGIWDSDPCEDCFVERHMEIVKRNFLEANGYPLPSRIWAKLEQAAVISWQQTQGGRIDPLGLHKHGGSDG